MAALWEHLPAASRTVRALNPDAQWTSSEWLLWHVEYDMRLCHWAGHYDRKNPTPKPKPLETPGQVDEARRRRDNALAARAEIDARLGMTDG